MTTIASTPARPSPGDNPVTVTVEPALIERLRRSLMADWGSAAQTASEAITWDDRTDQDIAHARDTLRELDAIIDQLGWPDEHRNDDEPVEITGAAAPLGYAVQLVIESTAADLATAITAGDANVDEHTATCQEWTALRTAIDAQTPGRDDARHEANR